MGANECLIIPQHPPSSTIPHKPRANRHRRPAGRSGLRVGIDGVPGRTGSHDAIMRRARSNTARGRPYHRRWCLGQMVTAWDFHIQLSVGLELP